MSQFSFYFGESLEGDPEHDPGKTPTHFGEFLGYRGSKEADDCLKTNLAGGFLQ